MKRDMRVIVQLENGQTAEVDAIKLSERPPVIRLVWEWANVDGDEQPNTYSDVQLPKLEHARDDLYVLTNHTIPIPEGIELHKTDDHP